MSRHAFDPKCPDCRPCLLDLEGRRIPPDDPHMVAVNAVWDAAPLEEQQAYHSVCVKNSRDERDIELLDRLMKRIAAADVRKN